MEYQYSIVEWRKWVISKIYVFESHGEILPQQRLDGLLCLSSLAHYVDDTLSLRQRRAERALKLTTE